MVSRRLYDWMYRRGAPWEGGPRAELAQLVRSGRLNPTELPRAIDLGCGSGANTVFLAQNGFDAVGVDFSEVALEKARALARQTDVSDRCEFVAGDLTDDPGIAGPFDLLVDYGTLDDLRGRSRDAMTHTIHELSRPGSTFLLWCFHGPRSDLPWFSFNGPSRVYSGLEPGEETARFGEHFVIERLTEPPPGSHAACFLMQRRT